MKSRLIACLLLLFYSIGFAQQDNTFRIDSLPPQGILLDKGWKFHVGDNTNFAKPDFDDSKWESIDPTKDIVYLKQIDTQNPLWIRLKIKTLSPKIIVLNIKQSSASEVFLNGNRIKSFGEIGNENTTTRAYSPVNELVAIHLDTTENTLAVRHFFQTGIRYNQFADISYPLFSCQITTTTIWKRDTFWEGFNIGVPFILFLVYFTIFLFYIPNKATLWFSLWGFSDSLTSLCRFLSKNTPEILLQNQYTLCSSFFSTFSLISLFCSIFLLLGQKKIFYLVMFAGLVISGAVYHFFGRGDTPAIIDTLITFVSAVSVIAMGISSMNKGHIGGKYVIVGITFYVIFWTIFLFFFTGDNLNTLASDIVFHIAILSLPVTIATLLGIELRNTNLSLLKNLDRVQSLAAEKQQILETQNETLERQVAERTAELKASQNQLIQKEKLASLGELTAGIAHEIQNPLNFVNNFSELSVELISELKDERSKEQGQRDEELENELLNDLAQNQEKINLHGKRASSIVSGMLEHSRTSTGEKALTDINKLADEYLRLAYHGLRVKDKGFGADYELIEDENLPEVEVIVQDIGRVLLNLINNAFWAVKTVEKPLVVVKTEQVENQIMITVKDNGIGMSETTKAKIFQPFFTTKPTGEGTGLGLSLAYDIVTKGHGGTLEVESVEGEGTTFIVNLPI